LPDFSTIFRPVSPFYWRIVDQFSLCCGCDGGSANAGVAGAVGKTAVEAAIVTQRGYAKADDRLSSGPVVSPDLALDSTYLLDLLPDRWAWAHPKSMR
jgi:hypothetical protein